MSALLIIDPQNDFHKGGSLPVSGAVADSKRAADLIEANLDRISQIYVSLDSHHVMHIAHRYECESLPDTFSVFALLLLLVGDSCAHYPCVYHHIVHGIATSGLMRKERIRR